MLLELPKLEMEAKSVCFYARVPSPGKPADDPSRLDLLTSARMFGSILEDADLLQLARSLG